MRKLLIPLLAVLALPTIVHAKRSDAEKQSLLFYGSAYGTASTLCVLASKNAISINDAKKFKKLYFSAWDGLNADDIGLVSARSGFDKGLSDAQKLDGINKKKCNF